MIAMCRWVKLSVAMMRVAVAERDSQKTITMLEAKEC